MEEEEDDEVEEDDVEEEDRSQDRGAHFARACAGDMHMDISQGPSSVEIYRENGRGHLWGNLWGQRFVRVCAIEMHMDISQEPFCVKFTGKMAKDTSGASVLCELVESKCTWTFHNSHFVLKFTGEMAEDTSRDIVLREPAQSKCTWIFHNSHCVCVWKIYKESARCTGYHLD